MRKLLSLMWLLTSQLCLQSLQPSTRRESWKYTPAKDASGNAVVRVTAIDSGSEVAPNVNTSATVTFTIALSPVNDAPVFTTGGKRCGQ